MSSSNGGRPHDDDASSASSRSPSDIDADRVHQWGAGLPRARARELTPLTFPLIPRPLPAPYPRIPRQRPLAAPVQIAVSGNSSDSSTSHLSSPCDDDDGGDRETESAWPTPSYPARPVRARKEEKPRAVWTPQLHRRFIDAIKQLGEKAAVPKNIARVMNVEGLTRNHVASHLQKYRLYLQAQARMAAWNATPGPATQGVPSISPQPSSGTSTNSKDVFPPTVLEQYILEEADEIHTFSKKEKKEYLL